jgi:hypothetical protein
VSGLRLWAGADLVADVRRPEARRLDWRPFAGKDVATPDPDGPTTAPRHRGLVSAGPSVHVRISPRLGLFPSGRVCGLRAVVYP